ncbi:uncharacterized protein BDZ99DRAFT_497010 [Mytilinidion resinicola]|uniref:MARVEL domain-containing protein n=1 Tax=Mytilinidion resinicola TaxID=574789 RepID=A0A6A6YXI1_9PEZI|nr:uncharacterized protein BDZ99DRAFT_497010 [Mytilinidion resinicola]KAF2812637.1 hypothetical protein BDZ99DRAFT_497010 [Mytilinidion resinicola]
MASKALTLGLRGLQFLFTLIIMALIGNMIATAVHGNHSIVNYDMFVATFGMLSLLYLIAAAFIEALAIPIVAIGLDAFNTLFYLIAGIATAAYLGVHSCSNKNYTLHNKVTNSSPDTGGRCREAQASTAFFWFAFATFAITTALSAMNGTGGVNMRGGIRRPTMSQV